MVQSARIRHSRANIHSAQGTARQYTEKTQSIQKLNGIQNQTAAVVLSHQQWAALQERPKLIAELADSHRTVSQLMMALQNLKHIARDLLQMKQILATGDLSPTLMNKVDQHKKSIAQAVQYQLFEQYVLDSSFAPIDNPNSKIAFKIPGLDLVRERLTNELVTLYVNNHMVPLAFDRTASDRMLYQEFALMFAYGEMALTLDDDRNLCIFMPDKYWRRWDLKVHISGQGGRYPEGSHITVAVEPIHATVEMATMLDFSAHDAISTLEKVIARVNEMHQWTLTLLRDHNSKADHLIQYCHQVTDTVGADIKQYFDDNPARALKTIQRHYVGPNRENVISLIKK